VNCLASGSGSDLLAKHTKDTKQGDGKLDLPTLNDIILNIKYQMIQTMEQQWKRGDG